MIEIHSSVVEGGATERHQIDHEQTLLKWLYANGISRGSDLDSLPMAIFVDGLPQGPLAWETCVIDPASDVKIYRVPKGTDPFSITFALIFGAQAALKALMPKLPTQKGNNSRSGCSRMCTIF